MGFGKGIGLESINQINRADREGGGEEETMKMKQSERSESSRVESSRVDFGLV